ncbi:hypothetical protein K435DRAFT_437620 [Dendrothele bispora CBS 962.96]|uniref:Uncharacterized protein n=1 Tax=Dendrothele bispora (strain CBS 962.96) TaxID=1314807 RepID=A0A4S8MF72_DENBC|nr:hypothetical protein K435DRAFT_437620 [Dendrothele bispora CBS 962.96]
MSRRSPILLRIISLVLVVISLQYVQIVARTTGAQAAPLPNSIMIQNRARDWQIESIGFELELDHKAAHRVDCATTPTSTVYKTTATDTYIGFYSATITNVVTWASTWFASPKTQTRVFYLDDPHDEAKPKVLDQHGQTPRPRVRVVLDLVWMPQGKKWYLDALKTWTCWVSLCDQGMSVDPK